MKTNKPLIGVTAGEIQNIVEPWSVTVHGQNHTYADAIIAAGGVPVILPLTADENVQRELYELCDAILFAGGEDVDPARAGQKAVPETTVLSQLRDAQEWSLMEWSLRDDKPLLGICRGMQLINLVQGGNLYLHALNDLPGVQDHEESRVRQDPAYIAHTLKIDMDSRLAKVLGTDSITTNTRHHQAVKDLGDGVVATAWAEDHIVEALEMPSKRFVLGVESHPEDFVAAAEPRWAGLFDALVEAAKLHSQAGEEYAVAA